MTMDQIVGSPLHSTFSTGILPYQGTKRADADVENAGPKSADIVEGLNMMQLCEQVIYDSRLGIVQNINEVDVIDIRPFEYLSGLCLHKDHAKFRKRLRTPDVERFDYGLLSSSLSSYGGNQIVIRVVI